MKLLPRIPTVPNPGFGRIFKDFREFHVSVQLFLRVQGCRTVVPGCSRCLLDGFSMFPHINLDIDSWNPMHRPGSDTQPTPIHKNHEILKIRWIRTKIFWESIFLGIFPKSGLQPVLVIRNNFNNAHSVSNRFPR